MKLNKYFERGRHVCLFLRLFYTIFILLLVQCFSIRVLLKQVELILDKSFSITHFILVIERYEHKLRTNKKFQKFDLFNLINHTY